MWRKKLYDHITTFICTQLCEAGCCKRGKIFTVQKNPQSKILRVKEHEEPYANHAVCPALDLKTSRCKTYHDRHFICVKWKCSTLNLLSKILHQPIWDGRITEEDYISIYHMDPWTGEPINITTE